MDFVTDSEPRSASRVEHIQDGALSETLRPYPCSMPPRLAVRLIGTIAACRILTLAKIAALFAPEEGPFLK